jgi:osmotically-inducible protein OsmY
MNQRRLLLLAAVSGVSTIGLSGCFPVVATGMVVGAFVISDRRTAGAQAEDKAIELKAFDRIRTRFASDKSVSVGVTSFNRIALITGSVPNATVRAEVAGIVSRIENVRDVINEAQTGAPQSRSGYGADAFITSRVKLALVDDKLINANFVKVVTESSAVFLMGLVTEKEGNRAAEIASRVPGVRRVVKVFETISDSQAMALESAAKSGGPLPETTGANPAQAGNVGNTGNSGNAPGSTPAPVAPAPAAPAPVVPAAPAAPVSPSGTQVMPVR